MMKSKLYIHVVAAHHFLVWELPYFQKYFHVVDAPAHDTLLFAFGPDALASGAAMPARKRIALIFPGFGYNPYHDPIHRLGMQQIVEMSYDLVFANPGPIAEVYKESHKLRICPFSIDTQRIGVQRYRTKITRLLHISAAEYPQKDWERSREVMQRAGLPYEIFPPRDHRRLRKVWKRVRLQAARMGWISVSPALIHGYENHDVVIDRYHRYDGFVHIAAEKPPFVDGKYTATLLEAGLTGCILFWHDTLGLGNDFETVFSLPLDPQAAANEIRQIQQSINVEQHSRRTAEEIYARVNPDHVMQIRMEAIQEL